MPWQMSCQAHCEVTTAVVAQRYILSVVPPNSAAQGVAPFTIQLTTWLLYPTPVASLPVLAILLQYNPWSCQLPRVVTIELFPQLVLLVCDHLWLEHLARLASTRPATQWMVLCRLCPHKNLPWRKCFHCAKPRWDICDSAGLPEISGSLVDSCWLEVITSHLLATLGPTGKCQHDAPILRHRCKYEVLPGMMTERVMKKMPLPLS